ncbi:MAG: hypothetical protein WKF86_06880 [Acidimicrobiales bacterium]
MAGDDDEIELRLPWGRMSPPVSEPERPNGATAAAAPRTPSLAGSVPRPAAGAADPAGLDAQVAATQKASAETAALLAAEVTARIEKLVIARLDAAQAATMQAISGLPSQALVRDIVAAVAATAEVMEAEVAELRQSVSELQQRTRERTPPGPDWRQLLGRA